MIAIDRGDEPSTLEQSRKKHLAQAMLASRAQSPIPDAIGYDVSPVRSHLYHAQNQKCAYCERQDGQENEPVEHFRPKAGAEREDGSKDTERYWWLAWTWENLFFACNHCNGQKIKGNKFYISGAPLPIVCFDIQKEQGIVDPGIMDPLDHIMWKPRLDDGDRKHWQWMPTPLTPFGKRTISLFEWDKRSLTGLVNHHIHTNILKEYLVMKKKVGRERQIAWNELCQDRLAGLAPFQAASWWALKRFMEIDGITDLPLPRPGKGRPYRPPHSLPACPLSNISDEIWLGLLAQHATKELLIVILCYQKPLTKNQIETIFEASNWSIGDIGSNLNGLVKSDQLRCINGYYQP